MAKKENRILVIGDIHLPYEKPGYLQFCRDIYNQEKCNQVVFIGDVVDLHAFNYHEKHPESDGPLAELVKARAAVKRWARAFPKAAITVGNHDRLIIRKAHTGGLPQVTLRTFNELWETPHWQWVTEVVIDGVRYIHGDGAGGGLYPAYNVMRKTALSHVLGHSHTASGIKWLCNPERRLFGMDVGCVDRDTEYLSPTGWKAIGDYSGGAVAQYDVATGEVDFANPLHYIKAPCTKLYHFETKYGLSQTLCENHNVLFKSHVSNRFHKIKMSDMMKKHQMDSNGFRGKFPCHFKGGQSGLDLSDAEIRLMVAVHADGTKLRGATQRVAVALKRQRKIGRLLSLLEAAGISFKRSEYKTGVVNFEFKPPKFTKSFGEEWWKCSYEQLQVVVDEVLHWDGTFSGCRRFTSKSKADCDFIQYAFAATGHRTSLYHDTRDSKESWNVVIADTATFPTLASTTKAEFVEVAPSDGYKYCFTMPKGTLILRNNGCIFATGNCGIQSSAIQFLYQERNPVKPVISCGTVCGGIPQLWIMPCGRGEKYHDSKFRKTK